MVVKSLVLAELEISSFKNSLVNILGTKSPFYVKVTIAYRAFDFLILFDEKVVVR